MHAAFTNIRRRALMVKRNVVHIEIPAADLQQAAKFYKDLFGWESEHFPEMNYATWEAGEGAGGGFNPLGPTVKPNEVLIYINSEDIEADLKKAQSLGATVVQEKMEIPNIGWFGVFQDLTGNNIALYTSMDPQFNQ
jgi:predicted enzyme related to lactoylglutathione lyase